MAYLLELAFLVALCSGRVGYAILLFLVWMYCAGEAERGE